MELTERDTERIRKKNRYYLKVPLLIRLLRRVNKLEIENIALKKEIETLKIKIKKGKRKNERVS